MAHSQTENSAKQTTDISVSEGFEDFLAAQNLTIAATSYQSGRLYLMGRHPNGGLVLSEEYFRKAMGLHVAGNTLRLLSEGHLLELVSSQNHGSIGKTFTPAKLHPIGDVSAHDLAVTNDDQVVFVNTRFNCLATLSETEGFTSVWSPPFLHGAQMGDRCHLNGLAIKNGSSAYVTGMARTCRVNGWRRHRTDGGFVMEVQTNRVICEGLSMPHSPRIHDGVLWVCNSGTGELGVIDRDSECFIPLAFCPGFIRGLAFHGRYAFVGLSRPRHARFEGLALHDNLKNSGQEPWTGVQIINTQSGKIVGWVKIDGPVTELYDIAILPETAFAIADGMPPEAYTSFPSNEDFAPELAISAQ
ncbi:MAG: TIGR03032 family protein [Paracoccaceae bacterium]|nr:TIGR03032 family protein [Paracoccaceae bacterium]MDG1737781.1 TIGR03032 family protein [Paracoccaceae bacterium]MDG2260122.1 TIGR03032 family protein [Paracoccaceae bacterium]